MAHGVAITRGDNAFTAMYDWLESMAAFRVWVVKQHPLHIAGYDVGGHLVVAVCNNETDDWELLVSDPGKTLEQIEALCQPKDTE